MQGRNPKQKNQLGEVLQKGFKRMQIWAWITAVNYWRKPSQSWWRQLAIQLWPQQQYSRLTQKYLFHLLSNHRLKLYCKSITILGKKSKRKYIVANDEILLIELSSNFSPISKLSVPSSMQWWFLSAWICYSALNPFFFPGHFSRENNKQGGKRG